MKPQQTDLLIVGAGISGLACAAFLKKRQLHFQLLEAGSTVGGVMRSISQDGFLAETGPNSLMVRPDEPIQQLAEEVGLSRDWLASNRQQKRRYILKNQKLHPVPMSPLGLLTTPLLSVKGKLALLKEPWQPPRLDEDESESVSEFFSRRLGKEVAQNFIDPMVTGIYANAASETSVAAAFPKIVALEKNHGGLLRGLLPKLLNRSAVRPQLGSFTNGLGSLTTALGKHLINELHLGFEVTQIEKNRDGFLITGEEQGEQKSWQTQQLIFALPAWHAAALTKRGFPEISEKLQAIRSTPLISITLGYQRSQVAHPLDGFGFLVPSSQPSQLLGVLFNSTLFTARAPAGQVSLTCMLGGNRHPELLELDDAKLLAIVGHELKTILGVSGQPSWHHLSRYARAVPNYGLKHLQLIRQWLQAVGNVPGLHFTGNYIDGISVGHCVARAKTLAESL